MPAQYIYQHSTGSNVDISARVRAYQAEATTNAEEGSVAVSRFIVDDQDGGLDIKGLRPFTWNETSETSNMKTIYSGYIAEREVSRGPFRLATSRQWTVSVVDQNSILSRRIMLGNDANRPAETDVARIQWMLGTNEMASLLPDTTYVDTSEPVDMDAVDYRHQNCLDIVDDCSQASGKNYFVVNIDDTGRKGLFYDFTASSAYPSTIRLTNVLADVDSTTTFAVLNDKTRLVRDPHRVYSGVDMPFDGGFYYLRDASLVAEFQDRDTTSPSVNVKTVAKAAARARRYLDDAANENDIISTAFVVPLDKVNHLKEGMAVNVRFSHLPGYETFNTMRVLRRTVTATSEEFYTVEVDLTNGPFTLPAALTGVVQYKHETNVLDRVVELDVKSTQGNLLVAVVARRDAGEPSDIVGWTTIAKAHNYLHWQRSCGIYYRVVTADESGVSGSGSPLDPATINKVYAMAGLSSNESVAIYELAAPAAYAGITAEVNDVGSTTAFTAGSITPSAGVPCIIIAVGEMYDNVVPTPLSGTTQDYHWGGSSPLYWTGYRILASPSGSYTLGATLSGASLTSGVSAVFTTT